MTRQLRDDITEAISIWEWMQMDDDPVDTMERVIRKLREALSTTSETAVQPEIDKIVEYCSDLNHFDTEEHNSPECIDNLSPEDLGEVEEWVSGLMRDSARMALDMYLDEQGIVPGIKDGREGIDA